MAEAIDMETTHQPDPSDARAAHRGSRFFKG